MKVLFKLKTKKGTFFIKSSSTYYYVSIEPSKNKKTESVFEFNVSKARIHRILMGVATLFGVSGAASVFLN